MSGPDLLTGGSFTTLSRSTQSNISANNVAKWSTPGSTWSLLGSATQNEANGCHGFKSTILDDRVKQFLDLHLRGIAAEIATTPIVVEERR